MSSKLVKIMAIIFFVMISILCISPTLADSGFDVSYDSGGFSGGSYDSGYSGGDYGGSHSSYSSSNSSIDSRFSFYSFIIIFSLIFIFIFMKIMIMSLNNASVNHELKNILNSNTLNQKLMTPEEVHNIVPDLDVSGLLKESYDIFKNVQIAWMDFDLKTLQKYLTDELYNSYRILLEELKFKNQKNVMMDFVLQKVGILDIKVVNSKVFVKVYLNVYMRDFIVNSKNGQILRGNRNLLNVDYILSLESNMNSKVSAYCKSCGALIGNNSNNKCESCGSINVISPNKYIMSKKELLSQKDVL